MESDQHIAVCSSNHQRLNMSLVDRILQVSPQPKVTWIQVRSYRPSIWKTSGDNVIICEGFTKQTLNLAYDVWWCPILHKNSGLNTVTFLQGSNHMAKDDWDFQISDLVKNPDGTDIKPLW